jgi:hypothetical protein
MTLPRACQTAPGRRYRFIKQRPNLYQCGGQPLERTRSGGITDDVRVGDRTIGWAADYAEPGVTLRTRDGRKHAALTAFSRIGTATPRQYTLHQYQGERHTPAYATWRVVPIVAQEEEEEDGWTGQPGHA